MIGLPHMDVGFNSVHGTGREIRVRDEAIRHTLCVPEPLTR
ncbi:hypothetical protein FHT02_000178 [Sphingomonas xinjiangensis]|uniref:Uncharacterized protein n=1 Tax=Sphingomonas xinjiangensis TaxID=643568 RepID=A0A840YNE3_9SPHN|nr:hypothetical protein [Sphingomonas xinjiangensis]